MRKINVFLSAAMVGLLMTHMVYGDEIKGQPINASSYPKKIIANQTFTNCIFMGDFSGFTFDTVTLTGCMFYASDLTDATFSGGTYEGLEFKAGNSGTVILTGATFSGGTYERLKFNAGNSGTVILTDATFSGGTYNGSLEFTAGNSGMVNLTDATFSGGTYEGLIFYAGERGTIDLTGATGIPSHAGYNPGYGGHIIK